MSDLRWREKMRKIEQAAASGDQVPEKAKRMGLNFFAFFALLVLIGLWGLTILSAVGENFGTATVLAIISTLVTWISWNVYRAPKLP